MADSTKNKSKTTLDAFADDLDAMLTMDTPPATQQVGAIDDDDDAIDRLLMGDNFGQAVAEQERDEFSDIDELIGADFGRDPKIPTEIDEFGDDIDDMIANIGIKPKHPSEAVVDELDEFGDDIDAASKLVEDLDEPVTPELAALESVGEIDEFADDFADQIVTSSIVPDTLRDDAEGMKEIEEFPDIKPATESVADFLLADFDISSGEILNKTAPPAASTDEFADVAISSAPTDAELPQPIAEQAPFMEDAQAAEENELEEPEPVAKAPVVERPQPAIDHSAELAALMGQITVLKKQQQVLKQELTEKAGKEQMLSYLEEFDKLQTEQKKSKRAIDALGDKKPVAAYVASGLAVFSLSIGLGLGFQGYIAKSQVGELVPIIAKLQEQGGAPAASDAAEREMLRKQIDELTVASGVASTQIEELKKALQGDLGSTHAGVDFTKQLADLSSQNMQMGEAIENLQNKVKVLEKLKTVAPAVAPKSEIKKPVVVQQNWAVNLIAFKQDWYAKRKAEEFASKGVPAKVVKSEAKGETWYRLFVDGFKSEYEAAGYAAKVKKTLNLDSVGVSRLKD